MKNKKKKSHAPIRIAGSAAIIGMASLTAFSVNSVLNYLNDEADREYWAAFNANRPAVVSEAPTNDDKLVAEVPDSTTDVPEVTTVSEETEPVVTTVPEETEPEVTTVPEETEPDITEEPDVTTDLNESDPDVEDHEKDKDIDEPDNNHDDNSDDNVVVGKAFDLTGCSLDSAGNLIYTVQRGDCLSKIGRQFEVDYREIGTLNHVADFNLIHTGERFVIPVSAEMLAYAQANLK